MFYLYILLSKKNERHYIGITDNPGRRLLQHNAGKVFSTKPYKPYNLIYTEEYIDKTSARKRELFLKKTAKARKDLFEAIHGPIV